MDGACRSTGIRTRWDIVIFGNENGACNTGAIGSQAQGNQASDQGSTSMVAM
jgi:hypothetical protein